MCNLNLAIMLTVLFLQIYWREKIFASSYSTSLCCMLKYATSILFCWNFNLIAYTIKSHTSIIIFMLAEISTFEHWFTIEFPMLWIVVHQPFLLPQNWFYQKDLGFKLACWVVPHNEADPNCPSIHQTSRRDWRLTQKAHLQFVVATRYFFTY